MLVSLYFNIAARTWPGNLSSVLISSSKKSWDIANVKKMVPVLSFGLMIKLSANRKLKETPDACNS